MKPVSVTAKELDVWLEEGNGCQGSFAVSRDREKWSVRPERITL